MLEATDLHVEAFWDDLTKPNRLLGGLKLMFTKEKHLDQFTFCLKLIKDIPAGKWTIFNERCSVRFKKVQFKLKVFFYFQAKLFQKN